MKIIKIVVDEIPKNCQECTIIHCNLPIACNKHGNYTDRVLKEYMTKRHEKCQLKLE